VKEPKSSVPPIKQSTIGHDP